MAASRSFFGVQSLNRELKLIPVVIAPQGASAPTVPTGAQYTASRTGTGAITVTLNDAYSGLGVVSASLQVHAQAQADASIVLDDISGGNTIKLVTYVAGTAADLNANANTNIFLLVAALNGDKTTVGTTAGAT